MRLFTSQSTYDSFFHITEHYGKNSPKAFLKIFPIILEICKDTNNLKQITESDFINEMSEICDHFNKEYPDSKIDFKVEFAKLQISLLNLMITNEQGQQKKEFENLPNSRTK